MFNPLYEAQAKLLVECIPQIAKRECFALKGEPEWDLLDIPDIERLPALQWKLINIRKMNLKKRADAFEKLRHILDT